MRFISGAVYRHKNCLDIDLEVKKVQYRSPDYTKLRVIYLNRNWQNGFFVIDPRPETVKIKSSDYWLWERIR